MAPITKFVCFDARSEFISILRSLNVEDTSLQDILFKLFDVDKEPHSLNHRMALLISAKLC